MNRYSSLFSQRVFLVLWGSTALLNLAIVIASLSLGVLVHQETHSAFLSASVMFGPSLAQAVGGLTSMSVVDTRPPRPVLAVTSAGIAVLLMVQAMPMPTGVRIAIAFLAAYLLSISMGARYGALSQIVSQAEYSLGRSAINIAVGVTQLVGFSAGALLVSEMGIQSVLLLAAAVAAVASAVLIGLPGLPARRASVGGFAETVKANRQLLSIPGTRPLLLALVVPNGLIVGCEALFVSFHPTASGPGILFAAGAAGMLIGDILIGRVLGLQARMRAARLLRFSLAAPFVFFVFNPSLWLAAVLVMIATIGYGATLAQQEVLNWLAPPDIAGQAFGFESSMRTAAQGLLALLAGGLADLMTPGLAMLVLALASLAVSLTLTPGLADVGRRYLHSVASPRHEDQAKGGARGEAAEGFADCDLHTAAGAERKI